AHEHPEVYRRHATAPELAMDRIRSDGPSCGVSHARAFQCSATLEVMLAEQAAYVRRIELRLFRDGHDVAPMPRQEGLHVPSLEVVIPLFTQNLERDIRDDRWERAT